MSDTSSEGRQAELAAEAETEAEGATVLLLAEGSFSKLKADIRSDTPTGAGTARGSVLEVSVACTRPLALSWSLSLLSLSLSLSL